ncbi:hypothetical protein [Kitasatospora sp. LaBMicrA B282]|uniref:hypothetical protein n=1 Tax=Kitasatospora sp. LaBMicrA B282 TaxID=3420949 RepID=UPI003D14546F
MPYSSIGEAVGAAMQHKVRLAHSGQAPVDPPLQIRYIPPPSADPRSLPGMVARLEEDAHPHDVAAIIEETTSALIGPLTQLTELVAAAADWARARLDFTDPHANPAFVVWTQLATAHHMLGLANQDLDTALSGIAECPIEVTDARHHDKVQVLRTRELLHDVMGSGRTDPHEARHRAALATSPTTPGLGSAGQDTAAPPGKAPTPQPRRAR